MRKFKKTKHATLKEIASSDYLYYNIANMDHTQKSLEEMTGRETMYTRPEPKKKENAFLEIIKFAFIALIIVVPIRLFVAQPFIVSGSSMVPTFENGEYLIIDEISYRFNEPAHGDVVVFRYPKEPSKFYIKRIIGTPFDTVTLSGAMVSVSNKDGKEIILEEPYVKNTSTNDMVVTLGEGEYFVMGDNRSASSDSRVWGSVPRKNIIGSVFLRVLPIAEASIFPGNYKFE